jgi:two-component system, LytTR family, response regulator
VPNNILIIDSDKGAISETKSLLTEAEYRVFCASSFSQAVKLLEKIAVDLILCATSISKSSGFTFLQKITQKQKITSVPFIFLANQLNREEIHLASSLGADGYICKPVEPNVLLTTIEKRLIKCGSNASKTQNKMSPRKNDYTYEKTKRLSDEDYVFRIINGHPTFIKVGNIKCVKAQNTYSKAFLVDGSSYKIKKTLGEVEKILPDKNFIRIHRSSIINLNYIDRIEKWFKNAFRVYIKEMSTPLEMSRRYTSIIRDRFYH